MIYGYIYLTLEHETTITPVDADIFITAVYHKQCITVDLLIYTNKCSNPLWQGKDFNKYFLDVSTEISQTKLIFLSLALPLGITRCHIHKFYVVFITGVLISP
jgi:hypothetical protein